MGISAGFYTALLETHKRTWNLKFSPLYIVESVRGSMSVQYVEGNVDPNPTL